MTTTDPHPQVPLDAMTTQLRLPGSIRSSWLFYACSLVTVAMCVYLVLNVAMMSKRNTPEARAQLLKDLVKHDAEFAKLTDTAREKSGWISLKANLTTQLKGNESLSNTSQDLAKLLQDLPN